MFAWMADAAAGTETEMGQGVEEKRIDDGEDEKDQDLSPLLNPEASFLRELNLVVTLFSLFSLPTDHSLNLRQDEGRSTKDHEANTNISRFHTKRRGSNEIKLMERRTPRFQTTTQEFRCYI